MVHLRWVTLTTTRLKWVMTPMALKMEKMRSWKGSVR